MLPVTGSFASRSTYIEIIRSTHKIVVHTGEEQRQTIVHIAAAESRQSVTEIGLTITKVGVDGVDDIGEIIGAGDGRGGR